MGYDPQTIATNLVTEVAMELSTGTSVNLVGVVRKLLHASEIMGWTDAVAWFRAELDGCDPANPPSHRTANASIGYFPPLAEMFMSGSGPSRHPPDARYQGVPLCAPLADLIGNRTTGYSWHTGNVRPASSQFPKSVEKERVTISPADIDVVIRRVEELCFKFAIEAQGLLMYGNRVGDIFGEYRALTEGELKKIGIDESLAAIDANLKTGTPANAKLAILGCRNILLALSNELWQVPNVATHPTLTTYDGKSPLQLGPENPKARIRAYLHERGVALIAKKKPTPIAGQLERIADALDELYNLSSEQGKNEAVVADAKSAALQTFFLIGEIARLTGFEPVTEISTQGAASAP